MYVNELKTSTYKSYIDKAKKASKETGRGTAGVHAAQTRIDARNNKGTSSTMRMGRAIGGKERLARNEESDPNWASKYKGNEAARKAKLRRVKKEYGKTFPEIKNVKTEDYQCPKGMEKQNLKGVGVGIPAINNKKWGTGGLTNGGSDTAIGSPVGNPDAVKKAKKSIKEDMSKYDSYDDWRAAGFPTKKKKKKPMVKVKTNREIGWEMRDGATGKVLKKGGPPVSKK